MYPLSIKATLLAAAVLFHSQTFPFLFSAFQPPFSTPSPDTGISRVLIPPGNILHSFPSFLICSLHKIVSILGAPSLRITRKWDSNITWVFFLHQQGEDKDPMSWGLFLRHSALTGWGVWSLCLDKLLSWGGSHQLQLRLTLNPTLQCSQHCQDHIPVERQGRALAGAVHFPWEKELFHWNGDAGRESQLMGGGAQGKFKAKQKSSRYQFCKQSV